MTSSQSQNPYVYCMNNPLRYIDPSGMMGDIPDDPYQTYGHLTAAELVYGIREDPTIFDDIIDDYNTWYDYWHGEPLFNDTSIDPYNLNPVSSNRQNPIGGHGYISAPLVSANGYGLYDSKTKDWDARVHINLFGGMSTPGAGATLIDLDVSIDEFNSIKKTVSGTIEIPIAETGANLVIDRAYYDKVVDGTTTTHRLYSGIGIGYGKKGIPGGGISTSSGLNLIFGTESEGGFYWVVSWD